MAVWLVTGGSGFLGRQVLDLLRQADGVEARALGRTCPRGWPEAQFHRADLTDLAGLRSVLDAVVPSVVVHCAGKTPPAAAADLYQANTVATALLLEALRASGRQTRVVLTGSAAELGPVPDEALPVTEDYLCRPVDAYGTSKWLATAAGLAASAPLEVMTARVFNPIGPGMPETQALGRFAAQLAEPGRSGLTVGNLEARRDFIDVRDVARALVALADRGRPGLVYHVGTGRSQRVGDGLAHLVRLSGRKIEIKEDSGLVARPGPRDSIAGIERIVEHTGWRPEVSWEQSLSDLWRAARERGSH